MSWMMMAVPKGTKNIHGEETFDTIPVHAVYCDFCPRPKKHLPKETEWRKSGRNPALVVFPYKDVLGVLPDGWVELMEYPTSKVRAISTLKTIRHACPTCVKQELPE